MGRPARVAFNLAGDIRISPAIWPGHALKVQPGDLSQFTPYGNGVYGYQPRTKGNPFTEAPSEEACGGTVYFDGSVREEDFRALMRILEVQGECVVRPSKDFAVFLADSQEPGRDGYLAQMRIVSKFGLRFLFNALSESEYEQFPEQRMTMVETLWSFIQSERARWGTSFTQDGEMGLRGLFGGDGDFAREQLSFGFMLENSYHDIYRIWSRAWLVTK